MLNNVSWLRVSARPLITDVTTHRAPSLDGFHHFRFYCSNFAVKYLLIIADILVITYTGELMFNIMICNITKIRIRLSICTSSEVVLSSICSLSQVSQVDYCNSLLNNIAKQDVSKLQRVQNCLARVVLRAPRFSPSLPLLKQLHWLPVNYIIKFKLSTLT